MQRATRGVVIRIILVTVVILLGWLFGGRQLTLLVDRFFTIRIASLPATPIRFESGTIEIAGRPLSTEMPGNRTLDLQVSTDSQHRTVLTRGPTTLTLGRPDGEAGKPPITPEAGDEVRFTLDRSAVSWPTPLEVNFMTGHAPSWKRHLYYRLVWTKRSGGKLEAVWRYEQWYYPVLGWSGDGGMTRAGSTGLLRLTIVPDLAR
jgi:hypothetical protein